MAYVAIREPARVHLQRWTLLGDYRPRRAAIHYRPNETRTETRSPIQRADQRRMMKYELFTLIVLAVPFACGYLFGLDGKKRQQAKGWLDGYLYQADLEKRRHPRSDNGQFKPKHQWKR